MVAEVLPLRRSGEDENTHLFEAIAGNLIEKGYSINPMALPPDLTQNLLQQVHSMRDAQFKSAGIGREQDHALNQFVRSDQICWIEGSSEAGRQWLEWTSALQTYLNRRLFLGLFSFESHFAHYGPGDFYKKHVDAFKGEANRVLTVVVYLNPEWRLEDGGELVLYLDEGGEESLKVLPGFGTIVTFLSEEFPHEVLPATRDRYSIAGWFRVNTSSADKVDPPL
jgi:SM-20-related protein